MRIVTSLPDGTVIEDITTPDPEPDPNAPPTTEERLAAAEEQVAVLSEAVDSLIVDSLKQVTL